MERQTSNKRAGKTLTPTAIDAAKRTNAYHRSESMKDFMLKVKKSTIIALLIVIPSLYLLFLYDNRDDVATRNEWIRQGIGAGIAYLLGRANFKIDSEEGDEA